MAAMYGILKGWLAVPDSTDWYPFPPRPLPSSPSLAKEDTDSPNPPVPTDAAIAGRPGKIVVHFDHGVTDLADPLRMAWIGHSAVKTLRAFVFQNHRPLPRSDQSPPNIILATTLELLYTVAPQRCSLPLSYTPRSLTPRNPYAPREMS